MLEHKNNGGQAMILTIIMLGGLMLTATAIAGLLTFYQIHQSNDAVNSAKAFFAADAALEWQLYEYKNPGYPFVLFGSSGVTATSSFDDSSGLFVDYKSQGFAGNTTRALETIFTQ